jgi:hypothetical protein
MKPFKSSVRQASSQTREGACFTDVWSIYHMLPDNTYFDLHFINGLTSEELVHIGFCKDGSADPDKTVLEYEEQMKDAFKRYGYEGYRSLQMLWNRGFGNSVILNVILDKLPEESEVI